MRSISSLSCSLSETAEEVSKRRRQRKHLETNPVACVSPPGFHAAILSRFSFSSRLISIPSKLHNVAKSLLAAVSFHMFSCGRCYRVFYSSFSDPYGARSLLHCPRKAFTSPGIIRTVLPSNGNRQQRWLHQPRGGGALPYLGYTGTCRWIGYGFLASQS